MFNDILKAVGPMVAAAVANKAGDFNKEFSKGAFSGGGFGKGRFRFESGAFGFDSDFAGKRLDELDLTADAPRKLVLFGPDRVRVSEGPSFRVKVEGGDADAVRFSQKNGTLGVMRSSRQHDGTDEETVISVTMPAPEGLVIAGSGTIETDSLAEAAKITIAGSGAIEIANVAAEKLKVAIMGSGRLKANGRVEKLKLNIAGSGLAEMEGLEVERAKVAVAGSGNSAFSSDGKVEAHLVGSGLVTVYGRARCSVQSMGAGRLRCVPRDGAEEAEAEEVEIRSEPSNKPAKKAKKAAKSAKKAAKKTAKAAKKATKPRNKG